MFAATTARICTVFRGCGTAGDLTLTRSATASPIIMVSGWLPIRGRNEQAEPSGGSSWKQFSHGTESRWDPLFCMCVCLLQLTKVRGG